MTDTPLFDPGPPTAPPVPGIDPDVTISYGRRVTLRNRARLDAGIHPVTGFPLIDTGDTCGDCARHAVTSGYSKTYHKCLLKPAASLATDIRVSWPACTAFVPDSAIEAEQ